ncbi:MAG: hypothetical protein ACO3CU_03440, partial [Candidatus Nanopelagicales bacterium]
ERATLACKSIARSALRTIQRHRHDLISGGVVALDCGTLLVDPASVDASAPLLHRGRMLGLAHGYSTESRELWTPDGRLAVHNSQVIAIIR